jgi:hypothetical protein
MSLFGWLSGSIGGPSPAEVRVEVWKLGVRHHGEALEGALQELGEPDTSPERAALLRACVRQLKRA